MQLIDKDALMIEFAKYVKRSNNSDFAPTPTWNNAVSIVESSPTVDAVPSEELFDLFTEITAAEYGKQRFFMQKDGTVYDRHKGDYLHNFDLAVVRFCNELSCV